MNLGPAHHAPGSGDHAESMPQARAAQPHRPSQTPEDDVAAAKTALLDLAEPSGDTSAPSPGPLGDLQSNDLVTKASAFVQEHKALSLGVALVGGMAAGKFNFFRKAGAFFIATTARKLVTEGIKRAT
jgi:hypothetical protein